ncbi:AI-2E family transporter [Glutamicibacter sp. V16R2B1]|uniref:AI-2E family transporter n=1 Tax=Glutamicibacter sp. V16R2B1 TaxID=2036207 RepID=UPI0010FF5B65|nr:AI-2E family transporter [Glutamicibacter sp. V16R2B1]TLK57563.1 AI-2E family transporter [Glutamicibacter sp. V16R2B1]
MNPQPDSEPHQDEPAPRPATEVSAREVVAGGSRMRHFGRRITQLLSAPARNPALGDEPDVDGEQQSESLEVMHPVALGFLATLGVGLALLGYYLLTNVGSLITWIVIAMFIALGLDPIVRFLVRHGFTRPLAVLSTMVGIFAVFGGFMAVIIPTLVTQITQFIESAPQIIDDFLNSDLVSQLDRQYQVTERINDEVDKFFGDSGAVTNVFGGVLGVSQTVAQSMFGILIVLVLAVYFLASMPGIMAFSLRLAPRSKRQRVGELMNRITRSVGNYVIGQASVAILNSLVALTLMTILGVPFAALLTLVVAMLAFIPLVGAVIAGVLVTTLTLTLGWQSALIYGICYFGYLQIEAYIVSPRIMHKAVAVPGAVAVISVIAGGSLAGITGALMAIPTAAAAMILLREVFIARQDRL